MNTGSLDQTTPKAAITEFMRSFELYEFPVLDPNSHFREQFRTLWDTIRIIGTKIKDKKPEQLLSIGLRGSYSHGHPYEGNDVDLLYVVDGLDDELERLVIDVSGEYLAAKNFQLCDGKDLEGTRAFPVRFFDLKKVGDILNCYMYGLSRFLYDDRDNKDEVIQDEYFPLAEKKRNLLFHGAPP